MRLRDLAQSLLLIAFGVPACGEARDASFAARGAQDAAVAVASAEGACALQSIGGSALHCPPLAPCDAQAAAAQTLRLMTWNIKAGRTLGLDPVIDQIRASDPDLVLLQEVDLGVARTAGVDEAQTIANALGSDYVFAAASAWQGGVSGIATLSRLPFSAVAQLPLTNRQAGEARTALEARLCAGPLELRVIQHHADVVPDAAALSVREILDAIARSAPQPLVFAGDFNATPDSPGPSACRAAGLRDALAPLDPSPTYADRRIDYVFVDPATQQRVTGGSVVMTQASDHRALVVDFAWNEPAP